MKNILSVFSLCAFVLTAAEPRLGSSLSAVFGYSGEPVTQADLDQIARSEIASFEIYHATFTGKNQPIKAAFLEMLRKSGKAAQSYHLPFGPEADLSAADETMRENAVRSLKGYLKDAASFGCEYVVLHASDGKIPPETRAARIAAARKSLAELAAPLREQHLKLAVELLPYDCLGNTPEELLLLLEGLPEELFGVCVDLNHGVGKPTTPAQNIRLLRGKILGLHISDNDGNLERHWMPGAGAVDFEEVAAALREINYRVVYTYEADIPGNSIGERIKNLTENFHYFFTEE